MILNLKAYRQSEVGDSEREDSIANFEHREKKSLLWKNRRVVRFVSLNTVLYCRRSETIWQSINDYTVILSSSADRGEGLTMI